MKKLAVTAVVLAIAALAAFAGYRYALRAQPPVASESATPADPNRKVLYWYDPMYPQQRFDKPGKSPFMDMQLVPKYADEPGAEGGVSIDPRTVQNLGVRTAAAEMGSLEPRMEAVGSVAYNERSIVVVQARTGGFVEKLYARAPLDPVKKGQPLVQILFPDWAGAQEEYLVLRRSESGLAAAARQRLMLLGMSEEQIAAVEKSGKVIERFTLRSPITGVIAELGVREGMTLMPGVMLFRLADLATVWVNAEVPETQAGFLRPGSRIEARVPAFPDQVFSGRLSAILPEVNAATRTVRARIEVANPGARLKPGMFATLSVTAAAGKELVLVPSEAVIRTGQRSVVIVAEGEGRFRPRDVELGYETNGKSEIRSGLRAGEQIVLSGQFLLDSEASLRGGLSRLQGADQPAAASGQEPTHKGRGKVTGVDPLKGRVELSHEPIASLQWPSMTMGFVVDDKSALLALKPGDTVDFELHAKPNKDGNYVIAKLRRAQ